MYGSDRRRRTWVPGRDRCGGDRDVVVLIGLLKNVPRVEVQFPIRRSGDRYATGDKGGGCDDRGDVEARGPARELGAIEDLRENDRNKRIEIVAIGGRCVPGEDHLLAPSRALADRHSTAAARGEDPGRRVFLAAIVVDGSAPSGRS